MFMQRKILAAVSGLLCAAPVLTLSLGEVLVARGHPAAAAALPGSAPLLARRVLGQDVDEGQAQAASRLARRALRASPLNQSAIAWLAVASSATAVSDANRSVLSHEAAAQGWRDGFSQRTLYNLAVLRDDCPQALLHAAALLRQNWLVDQVEGNLALASRQPACRNALVKLVADGQPWTRRWLLRHGASFDSDVLAGLLAAADLRQPGVFRSIAAPVLQQLVARNDLAAALRIWNRVPGHDGGDATGPLAWPSDAVRAAPSPFDWRLREGFEVRGQGDRAVLQKITTSTLRAGTQPSPAVTRLLMLPPGSYVLSTGAISGAWSWNISCHAQGAVPTAPLRHSNSFTVPAQCQRQWLTLATSDGPADTDGTEPPTLAPLRLGLNRQAYPTRGARLELP